MDQKDIIRLLEEHIRQEFNLLEKFKGKDVTIKDEDCLITKTKEIKIMVKHGGDLIDANGKKII